MIYLDKKNVGGTIQSVINVGGNIGKPQNIYLKELCFKEYREFPAVGEDGFLYIATDENAVYRFDKGNYYYVCVSSAGATGSQGLKGEKGDTGPQGLQGLPGADGAKGDKGDKGETGPQGLPGADGAKGDKGDKGETGPQGLQGLPGADGAKGDKGEKGDTGPQGLPGADGAKGDKGDKGDTGASGATASVATSSANGLMSKEDKVKLDGIETGANKTIVNNTLTSASTTEALSAAQGKNLQDGKLSTGGGTLNGTLTVRPTTWLSYDEGMRMHQANDGWSTLVFGAAQSAGNTGAPAGGWVLYRRGSQPSGGAVGDAGISYQGVDINSGLNLPCNGNNPTWFGKQLATYEQGTWTPKFTSGTGTGSGRYTRIGNRVFFNGYFSGQPKGTGTVAVTGLPFIPDAAGMYEFFATVVTNTAFPVFGGINADGSVGFGINGRVNYALTYADIDWTDMHLRFQGMFCTA